VESEQEPLIYRLEVLAIMDLVTEVREIRRVLREEDDGEEEAE
jgi:hypothetical protein